MAQDKKLEATGTFKMPKDGGHPERVAPVAPAPDMEAIEAKLADGAKLDELDDLERRKVELKAYQEDDARIRAAAEKEAGPPVSEARKDLGAFADSCQVFELLHEQVGRFNRNTHKVVKIQDLVEFDVKGDFKTGFEPDYTKPLVRRTRAKIDRLVALKAIRPLVNVRG